MQSFTKPFPADGSALAEDAGGYLIRLIPTVDGGVTLLITAGTYTEFGEGFTSEAAARDMARSFAGSLRDGMSIWSLVEARRLGQAVEVAAEQIVADVADAEIQAAYDAVDGDEVAERLREDQDRYQAADDAAHNELVADVQAGRNPNGRNEARAAARAAAQATIAAVQDASRPVRVTRGRVFTKPLNAVQKRAARLQNNGVISCGHGTGVSRQTLQAMYDRIGGELLMQATVKHRIVGLRLPVELHDQAEQVAV